MKYTSEAIEYAIAEHRKGRYLKDIAKELSLNPPTLSKKMKEMGCSIRRNVPSYTINEKVFSVIDNEEKAYWLGYVFAAGTISRTDNRITVRAKDIDYEHLLRLKSFLGSNAPIEKINKENSCRVRFSSATLKSDLLLYGHGHGREADCSCPFEEQVSEVHFKHFTRGYVEGSGFLGMTKNDMSYPALMIRGSEEFLASIALRMKWDQGLHFYKEQNTVSLQCKYPLVALNMMKDLYSNSSVSLDRKKDHFLKLNEAYNKRMEGGRLL